jgi:serine/threonine protein kinase
MPNTVVVVDQNIGTNPAEAQAFFTYMNERRVGSTVFPANQSWVPDSKGNQYVNREDVFYTQASDTKPASLYFTGKGLGEGSFGKVYDVTKITQAPTCYTATAGYASAPNPQVLKIQHNMDKKDAYAEFEGCRRIPHLQAECYYWDARSRKGYYLMNKIPGKELLEVLNQDLNLEKPLSVQDRIDMTYCLLLALKSQVVDLGLVHHDIKPENIMFDFGPPMQVNIIDYGMAIQSGKGAFAACGTLNYIAPEKIVGDSGLTASPKMDVYSLGRSLALLWRYPFDKGGYNFDLSTKGQYYNHMRSKRYLELPDLFTNMFDPISRNAKNGIREVLQGMLAPDPKKRLTIEQAITQFQRIPGIQLSEGLAAVFPAPRKGTSGRLPTIMEAREDRALAKKQPVAPAKPEYPAETAAHEAGSSRATKKQSSLVEIPLNEETQNVSPSPVNPFTERKPERTPVPKPSSPFRNGLAVLGALVFTGIGLGLLFTGVMAPLGLGVLATVGVLGGGAVLGGFIGGLFGRGIDKSKRSAQAAITSPNEVVTASPDEPYNAGVQKLAMLGGKSAGHEEKVAPTETVAVKPVATVSPTKVPQGQPSIGDERTDDTHSGQDGPD